MLEKNTNLFQILKDTFCRDLQISSGEVKHFFLSKMH